MAAYLIFSEFILRTEIVIVDLIRLLVALISLLLISYHIQENMLKGFKV